MKTIDSLRTEIDEVHRQLYDLLLRRRDLTNAIWEIKKAEGLAFHCPEREEAILAQFVAKNQHLNDPAFDKVLKNVMKGILAEYQEYLLGRHS